MPTILIVTADVPCQYLFDALLSLHGYDVISAESGRRGRELFGSTFPDVVMLDLNLPDMNALTLLRQLRRLHSRPPVIVLKENGTSNDEHQMHALGVKSHWRSGYSGTCHRHNGGVGL